MKTLDSNLNVSQHIVLQYLQVISTMVEGMSFLKKIFPRKSAVQKSFLPPNLVTQLNRAERVRPQAQGCNGEVYVLADRGLLRVDEAGQVVQLCDWFEVQQAIWVGESRRLAVRWVDPQRQTLIIFLAEHEQTEFMRVFDELVAATIVSTVRRKADNGTAIVVSVRRRLDGELFSAVVVDGSLTAQGQQLAVDLERNLRDSVGLAIE